MPPSVDDVSRLLGTLYEAAASPALWTNFLEELKLTGGADRAFLLFNFAGRCDLSLQSGFEEKAMRAYETHFFAVDVLYQGYAERVRQQGDWVGNDLSVIPVEKFRASEIFNDFMRPNGDGHQCGVALSGMELGQSAGMGLLRSTARGEFGDETVSLLAVLAPHVKRAFGLHRSLMQLRDENADMRHSIEAVGVAVISLGGDGRVIRMSEPARKLLLARDGLEAVGGRLVATGAEEAARLERLIRGASATGAGRGLGEAVQIEREISPQATAVHSAPSGGGMLVRRLAPKRPLQVMVSPFRSTEIFLDERPSAMVFLNDPDAQPVSRVGLLRSLYGLSPMEGRVADLLVNGMDVAGIAEQIAISSQTVRFYLKNIFRKTGTRRQSEVVKIVVGIPGLR